MNFSISGMSCSGCAVRIESNVSKIEGVRTCAVSLLTNSMKVEGDVDPKVIEKTVNSLGFKAVCKSNAQTSAKTISLDDTAERHLTRNRLLLSIFFLLTLMYITMGYGMFNLPILPFFHNNWLNLGIIQLLLSGIVMVINQKFFIKGFKSFCSPNMDTLISLGSGISFLWSVYTLLKISNLIVVGNISSAEKLYRTQLYFESSAMILVMITIGKYLESISKGKTTSALSNLIKLQPKTIRVIRGDEEVEVDCDRVVIGDIFVVRPGERIGADGCIQSGSCSIDESAITGESTYIDKKEGDKVLSGTINMSGYIKCIVEKNPSQSTLNQIIELVENATMTKAPIARIADKISLYFVPSIIILSFIVVVTHILMGSEIAYAIEKGICTLVVSCPCALGLATPVAIMAGSGLGARNGILIKNAQGLEMMGRVQVIVMDKTGTITEGKPVVTDIVPSASCNEQELLRMAYSIEKKSEHPLASAVVAYATSKGKIAEYELEEFRALSGYGVEARLDNKILKAGNRKFIQNQNNENDEIFECGDMLSQSGKTTIFFSLDDKLIGVMAVSDKIKESSTGAINEMKKLGLYTIMLTGDNDKSANSVASIVGVDKVYSSLLPHDKEKIVARIKKHAIVAMVGDGINDSPSLVTSDVGISVGNGSDIAIDSSQIVIVNNSLEDVVSCVKLGRKTLTNIKENLFWAFFYNIICIPLAAGFLNVEMSPMISAMSMSISSVTVCLNALRLNLYKIKNKKKNLREILEASLNKRKYRAICSVADNF